MYKVALYSERGTWLLEPGWFGWEALRTTGDILDQMIKAELYCTTNGELENTDEAKELFSQYAYRRPRQKRHGEVDYTGIMS